MKNIVVLGCCRSGHNFVIEQIKSWDINNEMLIYNFEDVRPINYESQKGSMVSNGKMFNSELETINIIVVRDLLNWWASYLKWITKDGIDNYLVEERKLQNAFDIWVDMMKENLFITGYIYFCSNTVGIEYGKFNKSAKYRKLVCKFVGGNYNENSIDLVVGAGGGSSFDGQKVKGSELKTHTRYKQILKTNLKDLYIKMLSKNTEAICLYKEFFFLTKDQKSIIKVL